MWSEFYDLKIIIKQRDCCYKGLHGDSGTVAPIIEWTIECEDSSFFDFVDRCEHRGEDLKVYREVCADNFATRGVLLELLNPTNTGIVQTGCYQTKLFSALVECLWD